MATAYELKPETQAMLDSLPDTELDSVYRYLWAQHVREDVESHAEDIDAELTEEEIDKIVERYVYEGDYDCNLSYWDNIENLIWEIHKE